MNLEFQLDYEGEFHDYELSSRQIVSYDLKAVVKCILNAKTEDEIFMAMEDAIGMLDVMAEGLRYDDCNKSATLLHWIEYLREQYKDFDKEECLRAVSLSFCMESEEIINDFGSL